MNLNTIPGMHLGCIITGQANDPTKYIVAIRASFEQRFALASVIISPLFSRTGLPDLSNFLNLYPTIYD